MVCHCLAQGTKSSQILVTRWPAWILIQTTAECCLLALLIVFGVSLRNQHPITPDRTDLFQLGAHNVSLPPGVVLGLADLGTKPTPQLPCEKCTWHVDGDHFVDICLDMTWYNLKPASVRVLCGEHTQLYAPKANNYPCRPHLVRVV